jgi:Domain of unknown function (DUF4189)
VPTFSDLAGSPPPVMPSIPPEQTAQCITQTHLCDDATSLLSQCQSKRLDCDAINKQAESICASRTLTCNEPTYSSNLGTRVPQSPAAPEKAASLPDQIEVGGENRSGYGAIAYSPSNRSWGESYGYGSRNDAERHAVKECSSEARDCELAVWFNGQCGAVAGDDNGAWGAGLGPTPELALRDAMASCAKNNGKDCELERVTCTR